MASEHPRSARLRVGRQLRYLVGSSHGWLGGLLFAPATRVLAARDAWLGWDDASRERHLEGVIGLARFLIRPSVSVRYLASRVLGLAARRVGEDFAAVYGIRPVPAETFVAPEYRGSCFLAAGWRCVGHTSGRRLRGGGAEAAKRILVLPLATDWDACLEARRVLLPGDGLDSASWAENEFGAAPLGDARLTQRLVRSAEIQARAPTKTFFAAAAGCEATVKGYYRMIEHPDYAAVSAATIVAGHRERTLRRMQGQPLSLLVQDGTDLNFATRNGCEGLGTIGRNRGSSGTLGLHLLTTFAVSGDGVPLGVVNLEFDAPDGAPEQDRPVEERKTGRWLRGLRHSVAAVKELDGVKAVAVTDREGDVFDMFHEHPCGGLSPPGPPGAGEARPQPRARPAKTVRAGARGPGGRTVHHDGGPAVGTQFGARTEGLRRADPAQGQGEPALAGTGGPAAGGREGALRAGTAAAERGSCRGGGCSR